ncbi:MAG: DUF433 domain-containing protein [Proteobacteria bacterium]|nr:DUF433 domain-containing protein [Pseudomonadota bacterium]
MSTPLEILDTPMYATSLAAHLTKLNPNRVRRWLQGYQYQLPNGRGEKVTIKQKPLVRRKGAADTIYASFLDVIDLLFIKEFIREGFSIQKLRKAFNEAQKLTNKHHFAHSIFFTRGNKIYMQVKDNDSGLVELFTNGQWVIEPVIKQYAKRIDFDRVTNYAKRWRPVEGNNQIVIDPKISFGSPIIKGRGITTNTVYDLYLAEGEKIDPVTSWYGLDKSEVKAAVDFERWLIKKAA